MTGISPSAELVSLLKQAHIIKVVPHFNQN